MSLGRALDELMKSSPAQERKLPKNDNRDVRPGPKGVHQGNKQYKQTGPKYTGPNNSEPPKYVGGNPGK